MLGPELETFKGNKIVMAVVVILGLFPLWLVYLSFTTVPPDKDFRIVSLAFVAVPAFFLVWLLSLRVTLHSDGMTYRSLFGEKEMRWDALERFGYEAIKRSVNFIPVGTYYLFRLKDSEGRKLRIGNRIEHPAKLGEKLIEMTYPALFQKVSDQFTTGQEVDFGAIRLTRASGIKVKKLFGYNEIPWDQVVGCAIRQGEFYIWRQGEKNATGWGLHFVHNAFVLQGLLNSILKPPA
jgi:hypothetical protein